MSEKEKAKAYDKVFERAKSWYVDAQIDFKKTLEALFPELKENEDEKIRKCLLYHFSKYQQDEIFLNNIKMGDIVTWIEKQGKQKPLVIPKFRKGDFIRQKTNPDDIERVDVVMDDQYILDIKGECNHVLFTCQDSWELVEKKPVKLQWRPTESQMSSIKQVVINMKNSDCYDSEIVSLYNDLKKLQQYEL